eukprot:Sspe_Gene.45600::Locus_22607_Transcript_1_1_Confidence_1.000_Length_872::g.45600::m.45600
MTAETIVMIVMVRVIVIAVKNVVIVVVIVVIAVENVVIAVMNIVIAVMIVVRDIVIVAGIVMMTETVGETAKTIVGERTPTAMLCYPVMSSNAHLPHASVHTVRNGAVRWQG